MIIIDCPQRSEQWFTARLGKLTGSRASDMLAQIRTGEAAARRDLRMQLACERLTKQPQESGFVNDAMLRGIELEPAALAAYEAATGCFVQPVGFVGHPDLLAGCSPDGHVEDFAGIVEVKCPKSATHLQYLRSKTVPTDYLRQITHNLWITGAQWCDFVSFDDRFEPPLQMLRLRVTRPMVDLAAYELAARLFLREVDQEVAAIQALAVTV